MKQNTTCRIVIFSDLHYAPTRPVNNGSVITWKMTEFALQLLEKLTNKINKEIKPDLVLNLGDLIEDFNDKKLDLDNMKFIWKKFQKIKAPFYSATGNHDLRSMDKREEAEKIMGYDHSTYSFDCNGYHFVVLGMEVDIEKGKECGGIFKTNSVSQEDIVWLKKDLKKNKLPCVICTHFGLAEDDMKGNRWFEKHPDHALLNNREQVKSILKKDKNVLAVFSGHQHWTKTTIEEGIPYFVIGSMTEDMDLNNVPDGVYFEVELCGESVKVLTKHIRL